MCRRKTALFTLALLFTLSEPVIASSITTFSSVSYKDAEYDCCVSSLSGGLQWVEPGKCTTTSSSCTAATLFATNETLTGEYFPKLYKGPLTNGNPEGFSSGYHFYTQPATGSTKATGLAANGVYYWTGCSSNTIGDNVPASDITCTND